MKMRTVVLTIVYDDPTIVDPCQWLLKALALLPNRQSWCVIGASSPTREPGECPNLTPEEAHTFAATEFHYPAMPVLNNQGGIL